MTRAIVKTILIASLAWTLPCLASGLDSQQFFCTGKADNDQQVKVIVEQNHGTITVNGEKYADCYKNGDSSEAFDNKIFVGCRGARLGTRTDLSIYRISSNGPFPAIIKTSKFIDPSGMNAGFELICQ